MAKESMPVGEWIRRLVEAYVHEQAIDKQTYSKELARVSQELTLVKVEHHGNEVDELDVEPQQPAHSRD